MDIFVETLIKRKFTPKDKKRIKLIFAAIVLSSIIFVLLIPFVAVGYKIPFVPTVSMIIFAIILYVLWRQLKNMQLEFEYIITNDSLDIDKIIAQKKRERLISVDLKTVEEIGIFDEKAFEHREFDCTVRVEKNVLSHENYYITLSHPEYKRTLIVFTPDAKMHDALKRSLLPRIARTIPNFED